MKLNRRERVRKGWKKVEIEMQDVDPKVYVETTRLVVKSDPGPFFIRVDPSKDIFQEIED